MTDPRPPDDGVAPGLASRALERGDEIARTLRRLLGRVVPAPVLGAWDAVGGGVSRVLPKGLLGRSMLIIVAPMLILLTVLTGVFMDRHWGVVTARLSDGVVRDIATVVDLLEDLPPTAEAAPLLAVTGRRMRIDFALLPSGALGVTNAGRLGLLDNTLSNGMRDQLGRAFSLDEGDERSTIEIRVETNRGVLRAVFPRNLAYAANWHFFLVWMVAVAAVLLVVSIVFLRNQIKPIQRLATVAEAFGKGRPVANFAPQGAREVRTAARAFIEMRRRIERQIEQRTIMLAGVGHDLRTVLTRFRLELALLPDGEDTEAMRRDVDEMEAILDAYIAFAKGVTDEETGEADIHAMLVDLTGRGLKPGTTVGLRFAGEPVAAVRPVAFRRLLGNLVGNAARYGRRVEVTAEHREGWVSVIVDDDGPGIPPEAREAVFRPFHRLDAARNLDQAGTGLGLAIARDIARSHGGDIRLDDSPLGGLRAVVRIPG